MTDSISLYNKILSFLDNEYNSIKPNKANDITNIEINDDNIVETTKVLEDLIHMDNDNNLNGGIAMETLTDNFVGGNRKNNNIKTNISNNNKEYIGVSEITKEIYKPTDKEFDSQ